MKLEGLSLVKVSQDPAGSLALNDVWGMSQPVTSCGSNPVHLCLD